MATIVRGKNPRKRYTVRYRADGRQRERSFATLADARDFRAKVEYQVREQTFADPRLGMIPWTGYAEQVVSALAVADGTRKLYLGMLRTWLAPWAGRRTLRQVTGDRAGAQELLNVTMAALSYNRRGIARALLLAVADEAVRQGKLNAHRLGGIQLTRSDEIRERHDFVFPSHDKIAALAAALDGYGLAVWLMRGCGLRIREALAVHREDFREAGAVLRVSGQAAEDGSRKVPLKHRKAGEYRDVPVPAYLWTKVQNLPPGPVLPGTGGRPYQTYDTVAKRFKARATALGIPAGFTPHSLRHAFVSALLARGVPITDVAHWLGHQTIEITFRIYGHLVPSAAGRARAALDAEYADWQAAA